MEQSRSDGDFQSAQSPEPFHFSSRGLLTAEKSLGFTCLLFELHLVGHRLGIIERRDGVPAQDLLCIVQENLQVLGCWQLGW